jgi:hypothetical protein
MSDQTFKWGERFNHNTKTYYQNDSQATKCYTKKNPYTTIGSSSTKINILIEYYSKPKN